MSPLGFQSSCVSQIQVLKFGVPDVGLKLFAPQGEALNFESPPDCGLPHQDWF